MKKVFAYTSTVLVFFNILIGCKGKGALDGNLDDRPAEFIFFIADNQGNSLFTSVSDQISVSYKNNEKLVLLSDQYHPFATMKGKTDYLIRETYMANKSVAGVKTFYLTFQGKTDTLDLDIHRVKATPDNGGNSYPVVSFNGRPMESVSTLISGTDTPDYFILKRR